MDLVDELIMKRAPMPVIKRCAEEQHLRSQSTFLARLIRQATWSYVIFSAIVMWAPWKIILHEHIALVLVAIGFFLGTGIFFISYWLHGAIQPFALSQLALKKLQKLGMRKSALTAWNKALSPWYLVSCLPVAILFIGIIATGVFLAGGIGLESLSAGALFSIIAVGCSYTFIRKTRFLSKRLHQET